MWVYIQQGHLRVESHPDDPGRLVVQFEVAERRQWIDDLPDDMPETVMAVRVVAEGGSPPGLDAPQIASSQPDTAHHAGDSEEEKASSVWEQLRAAFGTSGCLPTITPPIPLPPSLPVITPPTLAPPALPTIVPPAAVIRRAPKTMAELLEELNRLLGD